MKRVFLLSIFVILISGCALLRETTSPTRATEAFLGRYQSLDEQIMTQLDDVMAGENLTAQQQEDYRTLMRRQYQNMTYEIKDEVIDGDNAVVTVEIEVYDFGTAQADADFYREENPGEFEDDEGAFSPERFMDYRIGRLTEAEDRTKYTMDLRLTKVEDEWIIEDLTEIERQKIHGIYRNA